MSAKNSDKTHKNKATGKKGGSINRAFSWFKTNIKNQDDAANEKNVEHSDNLKFVWGFILACFSLCLLLALISHFFTGADDQRLLSHPDLPATNWLGKFGFWIAYWLIENTFGIASILIPVLLIATGIRIMGTVKIRLHKWFLNCMILMIWISAFMAFLQLHFESLQNGFINWGGMIGKNEISLLIEKVGNVGAIITLGVTALLYIFYLSDEAITTIRNLVNKNAKNNANSIEDSLVAAEEEDGALEDDGAEMPLSTEEEVAQKIEKTIPFEDEPSKTATTIDFGNTNGEMEIPLKFGEQALPLEYADPKEDMTVVVGKDPEKADISSEGALEPYDPKLDLEHYKYPTLDLLKHYDNIQSNVDMEEQQANKNKIIKVLSYFGVDHIGDTSTLIGQKQLHKHLQELKRQGFVTITQQDIKDYYQLNKPLPPKSLYLMFEDGRRDTAIFAQPVLEDLNFKATMMSYGENIESLDLKFLNPSELEELEKSSFWEPGTNGYRLEYINVFDRYNNYIGEIDPLRYAMISPYLERRYNHYLMDYIRDKDGVPKESYNHMRRRISYDYERLRDIYTEHFGKVPGVYVHMHANTGKFANNNAVSAVNEKWIRELFTMAFNREGYCFNQRNR